MLGKAPSFDDLEKDAATAAGAAGEAGAAGAGTPPDSGGAGGGSAGGCLVVCRLDLEALAGVRTRMPVVAHRRTDLFALEDKTARK